MRNVAVYLIRHGQTAYNRDRRFLGCTDEPLDEVGHQQARDLAAWFVHPLAGVYSSPLSRASQTAGYLGRPVEVVKGLRELHQGHLEGLHADEAIRRFPDFFSRWVSDPEEARVPGGETLAEVSARAMSALCGVVAAHQAGEAIAVVSHQMVIAAVSCQVLGVPLRQWRSHTVGNAAVLQLGWWDGRWSFSGVLER